MEPTAHFNRVEHPCRASRSLTVSIPYFSRLFSHPQPLCPPLPHSHSFVQSFSSVHSRNLTVPQYPSFLSLSHSLLHSPSWCPNKFVNPTEKKDTRHILQFCTVCVQRRSRRCDIPENCRENIWYRLFMHNFCKCIERF